jgi:succinate dehydrogenase / fumarate reductase flavoprotein subunit
MQTAEHEALRDDQQFCHVAAWEFRGESASAIRHTEPLSFENVKLVERSYK